MSPIPQCYNKRLELLNFENRFNEQKEYFDSVQKAEKEINRREKALQAYLEGRNLTQREIDFATDRRLSTTGFTADVLSYKKYNIAVFESI